LGEDYSYGPFRNDDSASNVAPNRRPARGLSLDHHQSRREIVEHFTRRQQRLRVVKTTATPRGQLLDWIPVESQRPDGLIASPPTRAAYFHNLRVQVGRNGEMAEFDGGEVGSTDKGLYDIDAHIHNGTACGSYAYVGGPGAG